MAREDAALRAEAAEEPLHAGGHVQRRAHDVGEVEEAAHGAAELWPHGAGQHEVHSARLDGAVGGDGADGEDGGHEDGVGQAVEEDGLQQPRVTHHVAHAEEEEGGEHGEGDRGEHALDSAQGLRTSLLTIGYIFIRCEAKGSAGLSR